MLGDGRVRDLPGGVEEYLALRRAATGGGGATGGGAAGGGPATGGGAGTVGGATPGRVVVAPDAASARSARKELARLDRQLEKARVQEERLHQQMVAEATDHERVLELDTALRALQAERETLEERWLELAETAES